MEFTQSGHAAIRRVELPLPIAPGSVNAHLVPVEGGWILVDCGMNAPAALAALERAVPLDSIQQIVLTHVHPDHSGMSALLHDRTGAVVRMHQAEAAVLRSLRDPQGWLSRQSALLRSAGVPEALTARIHASSLMMRRLFPERRAGGYLRDGHEFETALGPMRVVETSGHSAGHLCFHLPEAKVLIAGDQLLEPNGPYLDFDADGDSFTGYLESLRRLSELDVEWVLPAHGVPFRNLRERASALRARALGELDSIQRLRTAGRRSAHDIAAARWNRPLNPFEHRCGVYDTLACLRAIG